MARAFVPLAQGCEELEAVTVIDLLRRAGIEVETEAVVRDGRIITSGGPGTAMDFALELSEALAGREQRECVELELVR